MRPPSLILAAIAVFAPSPTLARPVTFAVVAFGTDVKVDVGGTVTALAAPFPGDPYFNGTVEVPDTAQSYKYVVDAAAEAFDRSLDPTLTKTFNDFFNRKNTIELQPQFGFALPDDAQRAQWTRNSRPEIFNDSYIPTVHFSGPNADSWIKNAGNAQVNVMFISQLDVLTFQNVPASTKNDDFAKAALKLTFPGEVFYGRSSIKFRSSEEDSTLLRERIYSDMMQAAGCPTTGTVHARVYYNSKPVGLYILQDDATNDGFIASMFYGNPNDQINRPPTLGIPMDGATGADFAYKEGTPLTYDSFIPPAGTVFNPQRIAAVSKALHDLDVSNAAAIADFESGWFDIETFFRAIAFEYLTGHWDSYWFFTTNFVVYDDPTESTNGRFKFYFIDQDFDQTFGVSLGPPYNMDGVEFPKKSYTELLTRKWKLDPLDAENRTIVNKLINPPSILKPRFEGILTSTVKHLFNPIAFKRKVDALNQRFRPEVEWDRAISPRPHAGKTYGFTIQDFDVGINTATNKGGDGWGIMEWVTIRATAVAAEFNFQWDAVASNPPGAIVPPPAPSVAQVEIPSENPSATVRLASSSWSLLVAIMALFASGFV